jgi:hypothetical protein
MKKDIQIPEVENVFMSVIQEKGEEGENVWNVYLINHKSTEIKNVFVSSKGYNKDLPEKKKTSTLRHFFKNVPPKEAIKVEPIIEDVFGLHNEYLVSFYIEEVLYDKKYIFLAESIKKENFTKVPVLAKEGVLIR